VAVGSSPCIWDQSRTFVGPWPNEYCVIALPSAERPSSWERSRLLSTSGVIHVEMSRCAKRRDVISVKWNRVYRSASSRARLVCADMGAPRKVNKKVRMTKRRSMGKYRRGCCEREERKRCGFSLSPRPLGGIPTSRKGAISPSQVLRNCCVSQRCLGVSVVFWGVFTIVSIEVWYEYWGFWDAALFATTIISSAANTI